VVISQLIDPGIATAQNMAHQRRQYLCPPYNATGGANRAVADNLHPNDLGSGAMAKAVLLGRVER
jgi:hypothetical protein